MPVRVTLVIDRGRRLPLGPRRWTRIGAPPLELKSRVDVLAFILEIIGILRSVAAPKQIGHTMNVEPDAHTVTGDHERGLTAGCDG